MKLKTYILLLVIFALTVFGVVAQESQESVKWLKWEEGLAKATNENKILLIDLVTFNCQFCVKMEKDTYSDPKIKAMIEQDFVPVKINPKDPAVSYNVDNKTLTGIEMISYLTKNSMYSKDPKMVYPTTVFIIPGSDQIFTETGYQEPKVFKYILLNCINAKKSLQKKK